MLKAKYKDIIDDLDIKIGKIKYEVYLGADIYFKKNDKNLWDIQIYKRTQGTSLEKYMLISAFVSIKRKEKKWFKDETEPLSVIGDQILKELRIEKSDKAESVVCDIIEGVLCI